MGGGDPAAWDEFCEEQVRRLIRLGFFPLVSLVLGMPGETQADVERTLRWVARLREERLAVFPRLPRPAEDRNAARSASRTCRRRTGGSSANATT